MKINRVIGLLVYQDIPAAHEFLVNAFGFTSGSIHRDAQGHAVHGEVRAGDFVIWLHRQAVDQELQSPNTPEMAASGMVVFVDDVDAHYSQARANGAKIDSEPIDQPYGQREYGARDPEGHRWWFATPLKQSA